MKYEPTTAVAKSYLDQLNRTKGISAERAKAVTDSLAQGRRAAHRQGKQRRRRRSTRSTAVAAQVAADAKTQTGRDAMRLHGLADTLKGRTAPLR